MTKTVVAVEASVAEASSALLANAAVSAVKSIVPGSVSIPAPTAPTVEPVVMLVPEARSVLLASVSSIVPRVRKPVEMPVSMFKQTPTIAGLAELAVLAANSALLGSVVVLRVRLPVVESAKI
jgi:hypothetical protein